MTGPAGCWMSGIDVESSVRRILQVRSSGGMQELDARREFQRLRLSSESLIKGEEQTSA